MEIPKCYIPDTDTQHNTYKIIVTSHSTGGSYHASSDFRNNTLMNFLNRVPSLTTKVLPIEDVSHPPWKVEMKEIFKQFLSFYILRIFMYIHKTY